MQSKLMKDKARSLEYNLFNVRLLWEVLYFCYYSVNVEENTCTLQMAA